MVAAGVDACLGVEQPGRLGQGQALVGDAGEVEPLPGLGVEDVALGEVGVGLVGVGQWLLDGAGVEHGDTAGDAAEGLGHLGGEAGGDGRVARTGVAVGEQALARGREQAGEPPRQRAGLGRLLVQGGDA